MKDRRLNDSVLRHMVAREDMPHPYRKHEDELGESFGWKGDPASRAAAQAGAGLSNPLRPEVYRDKGANASGWLSPTQAKSWTTRTMGSGVPVEAGGLRCRSSWAESNRLRTCDEIIAERIKGR